MKGKNARINQRVCRRHGIRAKASGKPQIIFNYLFVKFQDGGGVTPLGGRTTRGR
jgi:hypothetical protein